MANGFTEQSGAQQSNAWHYLCTEDIKLDRLIDLEVIEVVVGEQGAKQIPLIRPWCVVEVHAGEKMIAVVETGEVVDGRKLALVAANSAAHDLRGCLAIFAVAAQASDQRVVKGIGTKAVDVLQGDHP